MTTQQPATDRPTSEPQDNDGTEASRDDQGPARPTFITVDGGDAGVCGPDEECS